MIVSEFDRARTEGRIVLQPNRSWTWRANACLAATLAIVSGAVAAVFAIRGWWLVLPFTLAETLGLLICLYGCVRRTYLKEVLTFSPDYLVFERGVRGPERCHHFQRYFARFFVRGPRHPWYDKRIALHCRGQELEVGGFLNGSEKDALIAALRDMIQRLDAAAGTAARQ